LGEHVINEAKSRELPSASVTFDISNNPIKVSALEAHIGQSGYALVSTMSVDSFEREEYLLSSAITEDGNELNDEFTEKLFSLKSIHEEKVSIQEAIKVKLYANKEKQEVQIHEEINIKNNDFFDNEMEKLDNWADDLKISLEVELKNIEKDIKTRKTDQRKLTDLTEKVAFQRETADLEKKRNKLRRKLYDEQDAIEEKKETLIDKVSQKLKQETNTNELFIIQWKII
jgi:hypothetical protein